MHYYEGIDKMFALNKTYEIWEKSSNKEEIEEMFSLLTGMSFKFCFECLGKTFS